MSTQAENIGSEMRRFVFSTQEKLVELLRQLRDTGRCEWNNGVGQARLSYYGSVKSVIDGKDKEWKSLASFVRRAGNVIQFQVSADIYLKQAKKDMADAIQQWEKENENV